MTMTRFDFAKSQEGVKSFSDISVKAFLNYYDQQNAEWEPFIEKMEFKYLIQDDNISDIRFTNKLNINFTTELLQTLIRTYTSLNEDEQRQKDTTIALPSQGKQKKAKKQKERGFEYKVTPYRIVNYSSRKITVVNQRQEELKRSESTSLQKAPQIEKEYIIEPGQFADYEVDYEEQIRNLIRVNDGDQMINKSDAVKIIFEGQGKHRINNINLKDPNYYHYFFDRKESSRDYVGYEVHTDGMKKTLVIRSPYVINNKTSRIYRIKLYSSDLQKEERMIELMPDSCYPLRHQDLDLKFSIQPQAQSSALIYKWSAPLRVMTIVKSLPENQTTFVHHGDSYSVIIREKAEIKKSYNINIKTPVLLMNSLPCNILIKTPIIVSESPDKSKIEMKAGTAQLQYDESHIFVGKGSSIELFNYNLTDPTQFMMMIDLNQQDESSEDHSYQWCQVQLQDSDFKKEKMFVAKDSKLPQCTLEFYIVTDNSSSAGMRILIYSKNVVINNTNQQLVFCYDKAVRVAGQTINQYDQVIPLSSRPNLSATIVDQSGKMISSTQPFNIDIVGAATQRTLKQANGSFFDIQVKTVLSLVQNEFSIYSKVTTISPSYVIINKCNFPLFVTQSQCLLSPLYVEPGQKQPLFWTDAKKLKEIRFTCAPESLVTSDNQFEWSSKNLNIDYLGPFPLNDVGKVVFLLWNELANDYSKHVQVEKYLEDDTQILFVTFTEEICDFKSETDGNEAKHPTYLLENKTSDLIIQYYQSQFQNHARLLAPKSKAVYSLSNPLANTSSEIMFKVYRQSDPQCSVLRSFVEGQKDIASLSVQPDDIEFQSRTVLPADLPRVGAKNLYIYNSTNGYSKITTFSYKSQKDSKQQQEEEKGDVIVQKSTNLFLEGVMVSLICRNFKGVRKEFALMYSEHIQFIIVDEDNLRRIQLKMAYAQTDSNLGDKSLFPIVMYPKEVTSKKELLKKHANDKRKVQEIQNGKDYFNAHISLRMDMENILFIEKVEFLIQSLVLKFDDELIEYIFRFSQGITDSLVNQSLTTLHEVFKSKRELNMDLKSRDDEIQKKNKDRQIYPIPEQDNEDNYSEEERKAGSEKLGTKSMSSKHSYQSQANRGIIAKQRLTSQHSSQSLLVSITATQKTGLTWGNFKSKPEQKKIYIKEYRSSPIDIELTFITRGKIEMADQPKQDFNFKEVIMKFGLNLLNTERASIRINALNITSVFGAPSDISEQLQGHYFQLLRANLFRLAGQSNVLGNPINFVNHLGTGVKDFFYKPIQGIVKGPLEGGRGIVQGTSSLIKNSVEGTFGSVSKLLSSASKGLLVLVDDHEFISKREEDNMDRPKNILEGVGYGLRSTITGVTGGIIGVFEKPITGAKEGGIKGFFSGTAKGVGGLVVMPISGALDFFSKTSEGIKNLVSTDDKLVAKIRLVRPFYGNTQQLKVYDEFHSVIVFHLNTINRSKYTRDCFLEALYFDDSKSRIFIILTEQHFLIVEGAKKEVLFEYKSSHVSKIAIEENNYLAIYFQIGTQSLQGNKSMAVTEDPKGLMAEPFRFKIDDKKKFEKYYKKIRNFIAHIKEAKRIKEVY